jgi:hypothetical protein
MSTSRYSSSVSLDDNESPIVAPTGRVEARKHLLGSGEDLFDENDRPVEPKPHLISKVFTGSVLDLNGAVVEAEGYQGVPNATVDG